jgi:putative ABC transport system ATP-binding protein
LNKASFFFVAYGLKFVYELFINAIRLINKKGKGIMVLEAKNVKAGYRSGKLESEVLKGFSISMEAGAFEALMGPSGSGKSTFLHVAAGLISASSGEVIIGGRDITKMSDSDAAKFRRSHLGVIFQDFNLVETLSVVENIVLPSRLDHIKPDMGRLAKLIELLDLSGKEERKPTELSGGERQRVAIARALFRQPEVVLADEPTGNLDMKSSQGICSLLGKLNKSERSAILIVTHDPVVAAAANKVHFLKDGVVVSSFDTEHNAEKVSAKYLEIFN